MPAKFKPQWGLGSEKGPRVVKGTRSQIRQLREAGNFVAAQEALDVEPDPVTGGASTAISEEQMKQIAAEESKALTREPPKQGKQRRN